MTITKLSESLFFVQQQNIKAQYFFLIYKSESTLYVRVHCGDICIEISLIRPCQLCFFCLLCFFPQPIPRKALELDLDNTFHFPVPAKIVWTDCMNKIPLVFIRFLLDLCNYCQMKVKFVCSLVPYFVQLDNSLHIISLNWSWTNRNQYSQSRIYQTPIHRIIGYIKQLKNTLKNSMQK